MIARNPFEGNPFLQGLDHLVDAATDFRTGADTLAAALTAHAAALLVLAGALAARSTST